MRNLEFFHKNILGVFVRRSCATRTAARSGYLLIELLVAMTLFTVVVVIAVGSFVNALRTQRQVVALSAAESNLGIVMEEMSREIRNGRLFCTNSDGSPPLGGPCGNTVFLNGDEELYNTLDFIDAEGPVWPEVTYALNASGTLEKTVQGTTQDLTSNNVKVKYLNFFILGNLPNDHKNPRITITIGIQPDDPSLSGTVLNLETTISARHLDCGPSNSGC